MSNVIAKPFDAAKRIIRSVFLGSPNLFTTADLNRQVEAFKYQIDQNDDMTGVLSDAVCSVRKNVAETALLITELHSYLFIKGCDFSDVVFSGVEVPLGFTGLVVLTAQRLEKTYSNDEGHEYAGAKFDDLTTMAAANQLIYVSPKIEVIQDSSEATGEIVGILASIDAGVLSSHCIRKESSVRNEVSILENKLNVLSDEFIGTIQIWSGSEVPENYRVCNGDALLKSEYPKLYAKMGDLWNTQRYLNNFITGEFTSMEDPGEEYFRIPDLRALVPVQQDDFGISLFSNLGNAGGEMTHILTVQEMPAHAHVYSDDAYAERTDWSIPSSESTFGIAEAGGTFKAQKVGDNGNKRTSGEGSGIGNVFRTGVSGLGTAHLNVQPFKVMKYIIRVK